MEGFEAICEILPQLGLAPSVKTALLSSKRYLEGEYRLHIKQEDQCADHCLQVKIHDKKSKYILILQS